MSSLSSRYIPHSRNPPSADDFRSVKRDIEEAFVAAVERVHRHVSNKSGVYIGAPGTSVLHRLFHARLVERVRIEEHRYSANGLAYCRRPT